MIRLLTLCFSLVCLAAFVWFGVTVDLGERTLFGHLRAIGSSREARDLWTGARSKLNDFIGIEAAKQAEAARRSAPRAAPPRVGPPQEELSDRDREQMNQQMQRLTGSTPVQGRSAPRPPPPRLPVDQQKLR